MLNKKQIDNISKYCYDISKLVMGLAVIGNVVSDQFSIINFLIGLSVACVFFIMGVFIDRMEVNKDV